MTETIEPKTAMPSSSPLPGNDDAVKSHLALIREEVAAHRTYLESLTTRAAWSVSVVAAVAIAAAALWGWRSIEDVRATIDHQSKAALEDRLSKLGLDEKLIQQAQESVRTMTIGRIISQLQATPYAFPSLTPYDADALSQSLEAPGAQALAMQAVALLSRSSPMPNEGSASLSQACYQYAKVHLEHSDAPASHIACALQFISRGRDYAGAVSLLIPYLAAPDKQELLLSLFDDPSDISRYGPQLSPIVTKWFQDHDTHAHGWEYRLVIGAQVSPTGALQYLESIAQLIISNPGDIQTIGALLDGPQTSNLRLEGLLAFLFERILRNPTATLVAAPNCDFALRVGDANKPATTILPISLRNSFQGSRTTTEQVFTIALGKLIKDPELMKTSAERLFGLFFQNAPREASQDIRLPGFQRNPSLYVAEATSINDWVIVAGYELTSGQLQCIRCASGSQRVPFNPQSLDWSSLRIVAR
ncbi:MAG: hypothetical protein U1E73_03090 [Planctomycetota bacterium]